jgi:hypothetical protein
VTLAVGRHYNPGMETYTIVPRAGGYRVVATEADGGQRVVQAFPTEEAAIALLRRLQEKAGLPDASKHHPKNWRL